MKDSAVITTSRSQKRILASEGTEYISKKATCHANANLPRDSLQSACYPEVGGFSLNRQNIVPQLAQIFHPTWDRYFTIRK